MDQPNNIISRKAATVALSTADKLIVQARMAALKAEYNQLAPLLGIAPLPSRRNQRRVIAD